MPAKSSHLQLKSYYLKEIVYKLKDALEFPHEGKLEAGSVGFEISDITTPINDDPFQWRCELSVSSTDTGDKSSVYEFNIVLVGFFSVQPSLSQEQAQLLAETNSPALLYSTSREIIGTITRRSPYPALLLPSVTFIKDTEEQEPKKKPRKKQTKSK